MPQKNSAQSGMAIVATRCVARERIEGNLDPLPVGHAEGDDDRHDRQADDPVDDAAQPPQAFGLSRSRNSLPVLKKGTRLALDVDGTPVRGLRPMRAWRDLTEKAPKPRNSTRSPSLMRRDDLVENRIDDALDVAMIEMRILLRDLLDQFRFDHGSAPPHSSTGAKGAKARDRPSSLRLRPARRGRARPRALQGQPDGAEAQAAGAAARPDTSQSTTSMSAAIFLSLLQPVDRLLLAADLIDELFGHGLAAGIDAAVGQDRDPVDRQLAALGDEAGEPGESILDHGVGDFAGLLR